MMFTRRSSLILMSSLALAAGGALAQTKPDYPTKLVRVIVPFTPGISPDVVGRMLGERLSRVLGKPVVVENKAGASGIIGAEAVAKNPDGGHTLLMGVNSIVTINPHVYPKLPYNASSDFAPVVQVARVPYVLIATPDFPARNVAELISLAKSKPDTIDYASLGIGSGPHVVMAMFANMAGIKLHHVPFKTGGLLEVTGGTVSLSFEPATTAVPMIKSGKVRALAVTSAQRVSTLPEVPTVAETLPGYLGDGWQGIFVHADTPKPVVERLNAELAKIIQQPDVQQRLTELGLQGVGGTIEEFTAIFQTDYERWGKVVRDNNIRAEL